MTARDAAPFPDEFIQRMIDAGAINPNNADRQAEKDFWLALPPGDPQWSDFRNAAAGFIQQQVDAGVINPGNPNREQERAFFVGLLDNPTAGDWENFFTAVGGGDTETAPQEGQQGETISQRPIASTPVRLGTRVIPPGAELLVVRATQGGQDEYLLSYNVGTQDTPHHWLFSAGTADQFRDVFGTPAIRTETISDLEFQADPRFAGVMGTVDELPADESLVSQLNREIALAGLEDVAQWMRNDPQAMVAFSSSVREGWSPGRTWQSLSTTQGFRDRYAGFQTLQGQHPNLSIQQLVAEHSRVENDLRASLRRFRGPNTDLSNEYVGSLVASGWDPSEASQLLSGERILRDSPEAFTQFQELVPGATEDDFLDLVQNPENLPTEIFEAVNQAVAAAELQAAGVDVTRVLAEELDVPEDQVLAEGAFTQQAIDIAQELRLALPAGMEERFGFNADDFTRALFNREEAGVTLLEQLGRERREAAGGLGGAVSNIDQRGNLRVLGNQNI